MGELPGIDRAAVSKFFAAEVPGGAVPLEFELLKGGRSNLTYRVRGPERDWVLRRPPLGFVLPTAHDMAREFRVLSALASTPVPVPRTVAHCSDADLNGAPFYVMDFCDGVILHGDLPGGFAESEGEREAMALSMIGTLATLHAVDIKAVGLSEFGRPEGFLERQLRRWSQQWERSKTRELPAIEALVRALERKLPESSAPAIVHGDYRFGNMALDPLDPSRIVAIFDWEMATLGDPLTDLGYTLMYWVEAGDPPNPVQRGDASPPTLRPGFPTRDEIVAEYARRSGRDVSGIAFYQALAFYKLAVISEGIHARFLQGKTVGEGFGDGGRAAEVLALRGLALAETL
ncbi:MAG: phosphotransferase family protein [Myxococcota bacterium]|jgi:aminoglycoside phosphotransferase (APT) family kinase protein